MSNEDKRIRSVLASVPQNATAAKVMGSGVHYEPAMRPMPHHQHWDVCPPMRPVPSDPGCIDLTGFRTGRLLVMGLYIKRGGDGARWVVRCACGDFEVRSAKYLRDENKARDAMCSKCDYVHELPVRYKQRGPMSITEIKQMDSSS